MTIDVKDYTLGTGKSVKSRVANSVHTPVHGLEDSLGNEIFGTTADVKATATDATNVSIMAVLKQISYSMQQAANKGFVAANTFSRTADTNAYLAGDVVGPATGSTAMITFANVGNSGRETVITTINFEIDAASLIAGEDVYTLYFYNAAPASAYGDNAVFDLPSGDRASFQGYVDLPVPTTFGSTLYTEINVNKQVTLATANLYAYLVTARAYSPTSGRTFKITIHTQGQ